MGIVTAPATEVTGPTVGSIARVAPTVRLVMADAG